MTSFYTTTDGQNIEVAMPWEDFTVLRQGEENEEYFNALERYNITISQANMLVSNFEEGENTMTTTGTTRIYVASLADYNAGIHHGAWLDLSDYHNVSGLEEGIQRILDSSLTAALSGVPAEEWAIHDYEGFPAGLGENPVLDDLWSLHEAIEEHGDAYLDYCQYVGIRYATPEGFEEAYQGEYNSMTDFAEELFDELYLHEIPEHLHYYIDYEKFARDLECSGDYYITSNGYVFASN